MKPKNRSGKPKQSDTSKVGKAAKSAKSHSFADDEDAPEALDVAVDERKLVTQPYDYSVDQLSAHVQKKKILLIEVPYQREYVWDDTKASRLMESLLLNVPIPVCYFAENEDNTWEVIDGLQRVRSIARFLNGDFALRGLTVLTELNGKTFADIPGRDQRRIESRTIRFVVITQESHPDIKFDVFERLNTGAVKLLAQELRNCIYRGVFNDALHEIATNENFRKAMGRPRDARMRDEEMVLRFLALYANIVKYKPPLAQFLNEFMRTSREQKPAAAHVKVFDETMAAIAQVFDENAFSSLLRDGALSPNINRALFDAVTLSFAFANRAQVVKNAAKVRKMHEELISNVAFTPLVARATADRTRMHGRVLRYTDGLRALGIASSLPALPVE